MKTVAIVQARMGSTRLPGKVLKKVVGRPMLGLVLSRVSRAKLIDNVLVATSTDTVDNDIEKFCCRTDVLVFRGDVNDVLDRYYQAARTHRADSIVRITGDCPLIDPEVIDRVIATYAEGGCDYVSNSNPPTYPDGLDTEVFTFDALAKAWCKAKLKSEREHVTPYIRNNPSLFRLLNVAHSEDLSDMRWTVDEPRDLKFVQEVYSRFGKQSFGMQEILELLTREPHLAKINKGIIRNEGLAKSLREDRLTNG